MKKITLLLFILFPFSSYAQKNEIVTYLGKTSTQMYYQLGDVFQIKYERNIFKNFNLQSGLRYYDELYWCNGVYDENSLRISSTFNSYKFDLTAIFLPINDEHFKLKAGIGVDAGLSLYAFANEGYDLITGTDVENLIFKEFWRYSIKKVPDFGIHFSLSGNYYFRNKLFCSLQILYNQVFNEEEFNPPILRRSPISMSLGIGYNF